VFSSEHAPSLLSGTSCGTDSGPSSSCAENPFPSTPQPHPFPAFLPSIYKGILWTIVWRCTVYHAPRQYAALASSFTAASTTLTLGSIRAESARCAQVGPRFTPGAPAQQAPLWLASQGRSSCGACGHRASQAGKRRSPASACRPARGGVPLQAVPGSRVRCAGIDEQEPRVSQPLLRVLWRARQK
jgi:hypothetical protein